MRVLAVAITALALGGLGPAAAGEKGKVIELGALKAPAPAGWKAQAPSNKFRLYQFTVPRAEGDKEDAELYVSYVGGMAGSVDANIDRWKNAFAPPGGKVETFKVGSTPVTYLDVAGTYLHKSQPFNPNAKAERRENYRRLGAIVETADGPYFVLLTGPARTVEQNKKDFDAFLKALK